MDDTEISKIQQLQPFGEKQEQYTSPYFHYPSSFSFFNPNHHTHHFSKLCPIFSTMEFNNEIKINVRAEADRENSNSFTPSEDSSGEVDVDASDEEVSLDHELLFDGKTKKKIELLAAMVGVDTTEPVIVLTEVVRVLKLLKNLNQC